MRERIFDGSMGRQTGIEKKGRYRGTGSKTCFKNIVYKQISNYICNDAAS